MPDTRYTVQWSRPTATDRTRLTRWLDLSTHNTADEARAALATEGDVTTRYGGDDGLTEYRIVQRVDTPLAEVEAAFDLHTADALEVARPFCARCQDEALAGLRDQDDTRCGHA